MAVTYATLTYRTSCGCCIKNCSEVIVCLGDGWEDKTVNGFPLVVGNITAVNKVLEIKNPTCPTKYGVGKEFCDYVVEVELDDQMLEDPETSDFYTPESSDVKGISHDVCIINSLIAAIIALQP